MSCAVAMKIDNIDTQKKIPRISPGITFDVNNTRLEIAVSWYKLSMLRHLNVLNIGYNQSEYKSWA